MMGGELNSVCVSRGEVIGDRMTSCAVMSARGLLIRNGEEGPVAIREGDSCRCGDIVPGSMMLRRCLRSLAARLKSPNSETGDSVRGAPRDTREEDLMLPSLSLLSLSKRSDPRRES